MPQMEFDKAAVLLRETDCVAVLKCPVRPGDELVDSSLLLRIAQQIGAGHKIALHELADGAPVRKYGQIIGFARGRIRPGEHVHTHNLEMKDFGRDYEFCADLRPVHYHPSERMPRAQPSFLNPRRRSYGDKSS
jgi:altronate hydrolase